MYCFKAKNYFEAFCFKIFSAPRLKIVISLNENEKFRTTLKTKQIVSLITISLKILD